MTTDRRAMTGAEALGTEGDEAHDKAQLPTIALPKGGGALRVAREPRAEALFHLLRTLIGMQAREPDRSFGPHRFGQLDLPAVARIFTWRRH